MPKTYDSTTKFLVQEFPSDWLALAGLRTTGPIEVTDANLSDGDSSSPKIPDMASQSHGTHRQIQAIFHLRKKSSTHCSRSTYSPP